MHVQPRIYSSSPTAVRVTIPYSISICLVRLSSAHLTVVDKWENKLAGLIMTHATYPQQDITSYNFRSFLEKKAVNYSYVANFPENVRLKSHNVGCPDISFGPSKTSVPRRLI
jgi:hypothetical protein